MQVENVCYDYYEGDFQTMPTLDTLAAKRDRLAGPLSRTVAERPAGFALRFDGQTTTTCPPPRTVSIIARSRFGAPP